MTGEPDKGKVKGEGGREPGTEEQKDSLGRRGAQCCPGYRVSCGCGRYWQQLEKAPVFSGLANKDKEQLQVDPEPPGLA